MTTTLVVRKWPGEQREYRLWYATRGRCSHVALWCWDFVAAVEVLRILGRNKLGYAGGIEAGLRFRNSKWYWRGRRWLGERATMRIWAWWALKRFKVVVWVEEEK